MDSFKFDVNAKRTHLGDEEILEGLRRFAGTVGNRAFTVKEFDSWADRTFHHSMVLSRFGTWRGALGRIGITGVKARNFTAIEMIANLERIWRQLGRPPGGEHLRRRGPITMAPYIRHWGTLRKACEQLARFHAGEISREEMLAGCPAPDDGTGMMGRRRTISLKTRWRVFARDGHRCVCCGADPKVDPSVRLEIDHIVPVSKGGTNEESNLRTLCRACNAGKKDE